MIISLAAAFGLVAALWQGVQNGWWARTADESLNVASAPENVPQWERLEDDTFARWFPRHELWRTVRSIQELDADPEIDLPPASHRLVVKHDGESVDLNSPYAIEQWFQKVNLRATTDDERRDLAYMACFLLRQQHAELIASPEAELVLGPDDEIGSEPDVPVRRPRATTVTLPDSDIFDKQSYEIEENFDGSSAIRGQRMTLGNRIYEVAVYFDRAGRLERMQVIDTGETIDPDYSRIPELMIVEG
jgi:hypothetical protein